MQRWFSRLSFTFFILAALLFWEAYKSQVGERGVVPQWKIVMDFAGAIIMLVLGGIGVRARHRGDDP